jgi:hypothetical protein
MPSGRYLDDYIEYYGHGPNESEEEDHEDDDATIEYTERDELFDELMWENDNYLEQTEVNNGSMIIGTNQWLLDETEPGVVVFAQDVWRVSSITFFKYDFEMLLNLFGYRGNGMFLLKRSVEILQVNHIYIENQSWIGQLYQYTCKTFWIRLIQRIWRRKCAEKKRVQMLRGSLQNQRRFELTGRYGSGLNCISHLMPIFPTAPTAIAITG